MAFLNVYKSGYYHRMGKPSQFNCHPGDLYPSHAAAFADVDPAAAHLYLGTFFVDIPADVLGQVNAEDSTPIPLSVSRRAMRDREALERDFHLAIGVPEHILGMRPLVAQANDWVAEGSIDTDESEGRPHPGIEARLALARARLGERDA